MKVFLYHCLNSPRAPSYTSFQTFARVLLSKFPLYYQAKLVLIVWLIFFDGATVVYRKLRRQLSHWSPFFAGILYQRNRITAQNQLDAMIDIGGQLLIDRVTILERKLKGNPSKRNSSLVVSDSVIGMEACWEYDYTDPKTGIIRTSLDAEEKLFLISKWILSSEGMQEMEEKLTKNSVALLLERAAPIISFQPKLLYIHLTGTKPGPDGRLPIMDENGAADCYVKFSLVCPKDKENTNNSFTMNLAGMTGLRSQDQSVTSRIAYRTLEPKWNEIMEIPINGGELDSDGKYRNHEGKHKLLLVDAYDADLGKWGIALEIFRFLAIALASALIFGYVAGAIDFVFYIELTREQWQWKMTMIALTLCVIIGLLLSYMMSVVWRADDEYIGSSMVPLGILTDQREHALFLRLNDHSKATTGGRGVLRVRLGLSEQ
ncbi:MAG: hypothetical protein ACI90V_010119 [Bacillariaceae sp.]|jgi:hypothetical protein